jgi:prepilin-type processing-associated H-X9-DG protein
MGVSIKNGGSMELVQMGDAVSTFQVMSNELSTPKILVCCGDEPGQGDTSRTFATNFNALSNSNVSYLVGVDVTNEINPQLILSGDSNFEIGGKPVKAGLLSLWKNDPVAWQPPRHGANGNLGFADGNVQSTTTSGLRAHLVQTGLATIRLAIP